MAQLKLGLVGLGFGLGYMRSYLQSSAAQSLVIVQAACDTDSARVAAAVTAFGCRAFASLDQMLAEADIDAVALFTGPAGRAELVRKIIRSGRHVMTTKPFELDAEAAMSVLQEAKQLGKFIHMNSPSATPRADVRCIEQWQTAHELGRPLSAHFQTWVNYREAADGRWYDDPDRCPVAPIFRLGIYAINDILQFLHEPETVHVMESRLFTGRPTPDHAQLAIRFRGGELASVFASFCTETQVPYPDRLTLTFERGCVYRNATPQASRLHTVLQLVAPGKDGKPLTEQAEFDGEAQSGHGSYQWDVFARAIRGEAIADLVSAEQIVSGVEVIDAMSRSAHSGQPERVGDRAVRSAVVPAAKK
ncbi:N/A [soil metagenome]